MSDAPMSDSPMSSGPSGYITAIVTYLFGAVGLRPYLDGLAGSVVYFTGETGTK